MKKVISLLLVTLLVVGCFAGCAKNVTIECTCDCNAQANGGAASTEYTTLQANGNSGVDCSNMPSDAAGILKLYNDVANATKAVPNQKVAKTDPGASTDITALSTGGKPAGDGTMNTVKGLVKSFAPAGVTANYAFVNGVDSNVKDDDNKETDRAEGSKLISAENVEKYAKVFAGIQQQFGYPCDIEFVSPDKNPETPQAKFTGVMKSSDLLGSFGPAKITHANIHYTDSSLTAVIDPASGYLVQLVHHMDYTIDATGKMGFELQGSINVKSDIIYNWSEIG